MEGAWQKLSQMENKTGQPNESHFIHYLPVMFRCELFQVWLSYYSFSHTLFDQTKKSMIFRYKNSQISHLTTIYQGQVVYKLVNN